MVKSRFFTPFLHSDTKTLKLHDENDQSVKLGQALLSRAPISMDTAAKASFKTSMMQISRFIQAHVVGGTSLCPGSVYLEIVLEAMDFHVGTTNTKTDIFTFGNVSFEHPLTLNSHSDASENIYMLTELRHCEAPIKGRDFRCKSANQTHCSGHVQNLELPAADSLNIFRRKKLAVERLSRSVLYSVSNKTSQTFSSPTIYNIIFPRVVAYSEPYLTLKHLTLSDTGLEAHGSFQLTDLTSGYNGTFIASPALVDTLLHTAGFLANFRVAQDTACICASIEQALIVKNVAGLYSDELQVFCSVGDIGSAYMADAYAVASDGNIIAYVEGMCFKKLKLRSFQAFLAHKSSLEPGTKHGLAKMATKTAAQVVSQGKQLRADVKPSNTLSSKISVADCVSDIIRDTCALKNKPSPLSTLDELGIDSLLSIDLEDLLQKHFSHVDGFSIDIESCRTVQDVVSAVEEFDSRGNMSSDDSLRQHTATSSSATNSVADTAMSSVIETTQPQPASIKSIFMNVCGLDPTNQKDTCLSFLGIDSLMAIELLEELRCKLGINVDQDLGDISEMTYQQLEDACMLDISALQSTSCSSEASDDAFHAHSNQVDALEIAETQGTTALATPAETPTQCTKHLWQYAGSNPSLFMFHDGSGLCNMYSRLVGLHRDLHGIYSLESASSIPADSGTNTMEELSMFYIEQARLTDREGLILGGKSFYYCS
jgi:acyl carrier protein